MINAWTDAIWKSQKLRKGEHIMKKEHSKSNRTKCILEENLIFSACAAKRNSV